MNPMVIMKVQQFGTLEFVDEIHIMIYKDLRKSNRDTRVSEFLIKQVVHEDIRCFSYRMKKG